MDGTRAEGTEGQALPPLRAGPGFRRREVRIEAGGRLPYVEEDWRGALVLVERGDVDLHCNRGGMRSFGTGAMLWFDGLGLRALENPGAEPVVLIALSRAPPVS